MFTSEDYTRTAPVIIHYLGDAKPWTGVPRDPRISYYFRLYRRVAEREPEVSPDFLQKLAINS
jgi:lipopolysaccharide biosynthesis glycosyltransferase